MPKKKLKITRITYLDTYDKDSLNAIIETPMGSHAKYAYDDDTGLFKLSTIMPAGVVFPYNFGFLPSTQCEDGDPIDVLILMDSVSHPGCLIPARLIGVIEAEQTEKDGRRERNDRLLAVAEHCPTYGSVKSIESLPEGLLDQIEYFFTSYNKIEGKKFKPLGRFDTEHANRLLKNAMACFRQEDS